MSKLDVTVSANERERNLPSQLNSAQNYIVETHSALIASVTDELRRALVWLPQDGECSLNALKPMTLCACSFFAKPLQFVHNFLLTIMFSRAPLASQQLRNTGTNMFLNGAQKILGRKERNRDDYKNIGEILIS